MTYAKLENILHSRHEDCTRIHHSKEQMLIYMKNLQVQVESARLGRAAAGRVVAAACLTTTGDGNVGEGEPGAAVVTTENVVVVSIVGASTGHINEGDITDTDSVSGLASRTTVEVILLDVDTVVRDTRHGDVLVSDVADL